MKYGTIKNNDVANGSGVRVSLFVSGCTHHCKGCFQPETWNFDYGLDYTDKEKEYILECVSKPYISGLSILGGEPFEPEQRQELIELAKSVKEMGKNVWAYSGYLYEELLGQIPANCGESTDLLKYVDVLVDGEFNEEKKDISLRFRGSSNQRIIDVQASLKNSTVVLMSEFYK